MTDPIKMGKMFAPIFNSKQKNEKPKTEEELALLEAQQKQQEQAQKKAEEEAKQKQLANERQCLKCSWKAQRSSPKLSRTAFLPSANV